MHSRTPYKTSIFAYDHRGVVHHDFTDQSYKLDGIDRRILQHLARQSDTLEHVSVRFPVEDLPSRWQSLIEGRLIVAALKDETLLFRPHRVDIETCRHCNASCCFCPQSVSPKPQAVMPQQRFELVLTRLESHPPQRVALNHFNEPLVDPYFRDRVTALREHAFPLRLFTNGTLMNDAMIDFLSEGGMHGIVFNFPSLDRREWSRFMRLPERSYSTARRAIERLLAMHTCPVTIAVNANAANQDARVRAIRQHFTAIGDCRVNAVLSNTFGGVVRNSMVLPPPSPAGARCAGCARIASHLHVSWEGQVYLCCQDYDQTVVLGHLCSEGWEEIMVSPRAVRLRAEIYGRIPARRDLICLKCPMLRTERFE
jgi:hypothetical protein